MSVAPVNQIGDGQIQATGKMTMHPVTQISDGQVQATYMAPVTQIPDGQIQASAMSVSQIADGQPQAATTAGVVSQIADGQVQASATGSSSTASSASPQTVACKGDGVLSLTLDNGVLLDDQGRTGYIASNYQFQFDKPAQAGAIYASGWSICGNGSLALGGSTTFYQCLSGDFYNLYDRHWAAQCNPNTIDVLELMNCDAYARQLPSHVPRRPYLRSFRPRSIYTLCTALPVTTEPRHLSSTVNTVSHK